MGNAGPESNSWNWQFRGQRIIEALFTALAAGVDVTNTSTLHFLNHTHADVTTSSTHTLTAQSKVLFAGCSAGARGAMMSADYIQPMLPPGSPPVLAFFDSPLWVDIYPAEASIMPLENQTQLVYGLVNASGRIPADCAAAYPGDEGWKCLYGQYRMPFVRVPYLMSASQADKYQLTYNEGGSPPYVGSNATYADAFQQAVRSVMLTLPVPSTQPRSAVYSSACYKHCTSTLAWGSFWGVKVDNVSLREFLAAWYFGGAQPTGENGGVGALPIGPGSLSGGKHVPALKQQWIEACSGFGCGQCHARVALPAPPLPPSYASYAASRLPGSSARGREPRKSAVFLGVLAIVLAASVGVMLLRFRLGKRVHQQILLGGEGWMGETTPLRVPPRAARGVAERSGL